MAVTALSRLVAGAPAPVFAAVGPGMASASDDLSTAPGLEFRPSIRGASLLLVAGTPRPADVPALRRLHDQMPHPRATIWWRAEPDPAFCGRGMVAADDPEAVIVAAHRALLAGERDSEPDILPDEPPNAWRGVGPHGQGGEGMMGGTPYGRAMPMMGEELRDGLMLDAYTARFGPFLPVLPPGLALELTLQGDVIQKAAVRRPPYDGAVSGQADAFRLAARLLDLLGLAAHAAGLRRVARGGPDLSGGKLARLIRLSAAIRAIPPGLGALPEGPVRDASGGIDVRARLRRWLDGEAAGGSAPSDSGVRLVDLLPGLEWSEAMLVLNSFEPPVLAAMCPVEAEGEEDEEDGDADEGRGGGHSDYGGHGDGNGHDGQDGAR